MDWGSVVNAVLFAIFGAVTAAIQAVVGPTYDNLFVPEMAPTALYAPFVGPGHANNLFAQGAAFSNYVLVGVVDPLAVLVMVVIGVLYLVRASLPSLGTMWTGLVPRLVLGILLANMVLPLAGMLWDIAAAVYPIFYTYGGGQWQSYGNIVAPGAVSFTWDNGLLAFVASMALLSLVLVLTLLVAVRDALLAVLLVLLPPLTLLWPIPGLSGLAGRAWRLFGEMVFLPSLLVVPLALAVGAPSILVVLALFSVAVSLPVLVSQVGGSLSGGGFPHGGSLSYGGMLNGTRSAGSAASGGAQMGIQGFRQGYAGPEAKSTASSADAVGSNGGLMGGGAGAGVPNVGSGLAGKAGGSGGGSKTMATKIPGGPAALVGGVLWGAGRGLGALGRHMATRVQKTRNNRENPLRSVSPGGSVGA